MATEPMSPSVPPSPHERRKLGFPSSCPAELHTTMASSCLEGNDYSEALRSYQQALALFQQEYQSSDGATAIVQKCNAASTLYNIGLTHKKCGQYGQGITCLEEAEYLYRECMGDVAAFSAADQQEKEATNSVCLMETLAETTQMRATFHLRFFNDIKAAVSRHAEVITMITSKERDSTARIVGDVEFAAPSPEQRSKLLSTSFGILLNLYKERKSESVLRKLEECLLASSDDSNADVTELVASVQLNLATLCLECDQTDLAMKFLRQCMEAHGEWTHPDVMECMNKMGQAYERKGDLGKALDCHQQLLQLKRQTLGEDHVSIADSSMTVARVMELRGERHGALSKYKNALDIYQTTENADDSFERITNALKRVAMLYNEQGMVDEAIASYQQVIVLRSAAMMAATVDEATVFLRLAEAFVKKSSTQAALGCIEEAEQILLSLELTDHYAAQLNEEVQSMKRKLATSKDDIPPSITKGTERSEQQPVDEDEKADHDARITFEELSQQDSTAEPAGILFLPSSSLEGDASDCASELSSTLSQSLRVGRESLMGSSIKETIEEDKPLRAPIEKTIDLHRVRSVPSTTVPTSDESNSSESDMRQEPGDPELTVSFLEELEESEEEPPAQPNPFDEHEASPEPSEDANDWTAFSLPSLSSMPSDCEDEDSHSDLNAKSATAAPHIASTSRGSTEPTHPSTDQVDKIESRRADSSASDALDTNQSQALTSVNDVSYTEFEHRSAQGSETEGTESGYETYDEGETDFTSTVGSSTNDFHSCVSNEPQGYPFTSPLGLQEEGFTDEQGFVNQRLPKPETDRSQTPSNETREMLRLELSPKSIPESPSKVSPRMRFAKVFSRTFRRRRATKPSPLHSTPEEDVLKEETQEPLLSPSNKDEENETDGESIDSKRPINFVKLKNSSFDDAMSQVTVRTEDFRESNGERWWWGTKSERSDGWFPAVVARTLEDFLSAKSIHKMRNVNDLTNSFDDNDDDSDPFEDLTDEDGTLESSRRERSTPQKDEVSQLSAEGLEVLLENTLTHSDDDSMRAPNETKEEKFVPAVRISVTAERQHSVTSRKRGSPSPRSESRLAALEKTLESQRTALGHKHTRVASTLVNLSMAQVELGRLDDAVETILEAVVIQRDRDQPADLVRSLHMLANIYGIQNENDEALACYNDLLRLETLIHGPSHPEIAGTLNRVGQIYSSQGMFYEAMEKHLQALQILKVCFGEDLSHPGVSRTLINIGEVYYRERNSLSNIRSNSEDYKTFIETGMLDVISQAHEDQGTYKMAVSFLEEKLQVINSGCTDISDTQMASTLMNLGTLSCKAGQFLEALDYYDQALKIQKRMGCQDVELATGKVLKGTVEYHLGQYQKALALFRGAIDTLTSNLGRRHEIVADTYQRIGVVEACLWDHETALDHLNEALAIQKILLGNDDIATLKTRLEIGKVMMMQFKINDAIKEIQEVKRAQVAIFGASHPIVADTILVLGEAFRMKREYTKALNYFKVSFNMRARFLGKDHPCQAENMHLIALLLLTKAKTKRACQICNSVLDIRKEALGENHLDVAKTLCTLGRCYASLGKLSGSTQAFKSALPIAEASLGDAHPFVGEIHVTKGELFLRKCQFEAAKGSIGKGLGIYISAKLHPKHVLISEAKELLETVDRDEMLCV